MDYSLPESAYLRFARDVYGAQAHMVFVEWQGDDYGPAIGVFDSSGSPLEPDLSAPWWDTFYLTEYFRMHCPETARFVVEHYAIPDRTDEDTPDGLRLDPYTGEIMVSIKE